MKYRCFLLQDATYNLKNDVLNIFHLHFLLKCDDVSLNSPICVVTPDGYVDSVFDDTPLTKCPPNTQDDLQMKVQTSDIWNQSQ